MSAEVPRQLDIRWRSAVCARNDAFDRELVRLLGDGALDIESGAVAVDITESAVHGGPAYLLRLQLAVAAGQSERKLELASCTDARHAAALLIGTALEQGQGARSASSAEANVSVVRAWHAQLGLLVDRGTLPGLTGGPHALLGFQRFGLRLRAGAHYLVAREANDDDSALVAAIDQLAGALGAAYLWPLGQLRVGPSLDAELGVLRARPRGEASRSQKSQLWGAALLGVAAELAASERVTVALSAQVSVPVSRPQFSLIDEPAFYDTAAVGFRAGLGVRLRFAFKNEPEHGQ